MTIKLIKCLNLIILLLVAMPVAAETTRCTAITMLPFAIEKQGSYCLIRNLSYKEGNGSAIAVNTNNVIIDLNGFTLSGLAAGPTTIARGIFAFNRQNITIKNGSIRGFERGIYLNDSSPSFTISQRHLIEDIRASKNTVEGFRLQGSDIIVRRNQVVDTGGKPLNTTGIFIEGRGARVLDNDISRTMSPDTRNVVGIFLWKADGAVVNNNRIEHVSSGTSASYGVLILDARNVMVSANRISSARWGIYYSVDSTGKYMDNLTSNVTTPFFGGTPIGVND